MAEKFQAPKVIVTPTMLKAGMDFMAKCMAIDEENEAKIEAGEEVDDPILDGDIVIGIFLAVWNAYWDEINQTHKRKQGPILKPVNLILPN